MFFGSVEKPPRLSEFELNIPEKLVAQIPLKKRDQCNLMVLNRKEQTIKHRKFADIIDYFDKGDVVVMNNTRVYPARLYATKDKSEARVEVFLLRELADDLWEAMVKPARKVRIGNKLIFGDGIECDVIDNTISGGRVLRFEYNASNLHEFIEKNGLSPLPPYIKRNPVPSDKKNYQTVYASERGSVAAPTAGLHFDYPLIESIEARGVHTAMITLHVGAGTFQPVRVTQVRQHRMHEEWMSVPQSVIADIDTARNRGGRVIAVGTTVVRALETAALAGQLKPFEGHTGLFVYPGYQFAVVDCLITNFHLPRSTLLMLVSAFGGVACVRAAYRHALDSDYRFFSYGDAMWLERSRP